MAPTTSAGTKRRVATARLDPGSLFNASILQVLTR